MPLPGGSSDKLGNRYELWWTVAQLERMLHGEISSIRIEDPGIDKAEFVVHVAGHRELHQSKRSHPSGKWSVASLAAADVEVLQAIFGQLCGNNDEFVFVSESHAGELAELAHRACSAQTAHEFEATFLQARDVREIFERLRRAWQSCDTETAWGILRRVQVRSTDERSLSERVHIGAQALFLADPNDVCSALRTVSLDSLHKTVTRDDLIELLKERTFVLRRLVDGAPATAVVTEATTRYLDSTRPRLIRRVLLRRAATDALISKLGSDAGDSVVTGAAGTGKTGCIVDFVERLLTRGIPVLAFRLDRIEPVSTPLDLGKKLGFEESPTLILAAAADGREAVLVIDQLDAVSTTSGRATSFLDAVEGLLIEARGLRERLPLHVVVACREFDWKNDHRLRTILPKDHTEVTVGEFTLAEVTDTLIAESYDPTRFQNRQIELLRLPQNLSLFLESGFDKDRPPVFNTTIELFDRYWDQKQRAVAQRAAPASNFWAEVIRVMVEKMAATQQLSVPREILDHVPADYIDQMASEGVVSRDGVRYAFGHESFFDYCFARSYVRNNQSLVSFLTSSEQHLFRRAQVRQVLIYLRGTDRQRYLRELRDLVTDTKIRPHLTSVTVALLADVPEPTCAEWAIWEQLLGPVFKAFADDRTSNDKLANMSWQHFFGSPSWFRYAADHGLVAKWLSSADGLVNAAMQYVRLHERHSPDLVVELLEPYVGVGGKWPARLAYVVQWSEKVGSRRFLDFVLRLIDDGTLDAARGPIAANSTFWSMFYGLGKKRPEWIPEVLAHWLRRRTATAKLEGKKLGHSLEFDHDQFADEPIGEGAKNAPSQFVEHVLPVVLEISDEATDPSQEPPKRDGVWPYLFEHAGPLGATFKGLKTSLSSLAKDPAADLATVISELRRREAYVANFLLLVLYAANGARFADEAATLLSEQPWRFNCGLIDSRYWTAMESISAIVPHSSAESRARLENAILNYSPSFERGREGYKSAGHACFTLLSAIPSHARSASGSVRYRELERKFQKPDVAPRGFIFGMVGSPIEPKATDRMTDDQWLRALTTYRSERREFRRVDDALKGGAIELARQLQTYVEKDPERFARLALRFPNDTHYAYYQHVLYGLKNAAIPCDLKLDVCREAYSNCREESGGHIAQVLASLEDPLSDDVIAMLDWLATEHPDPQKEHSQDPAGSANAYDYDLHDDLYLEGINTTRGQAVGAIGDLILKDAAYIKTFDTSLARMIQDPSAAVRSCVARTLRAVAHHDIARALSFLSQMNLSEDRLLATQHMDDLIVAAFAGHFHQVRPVVERMLRSQESDVAQSGARLAALSSLYHPEEEELEAEAFAGTARQRLGVAMVASANIGSEKHRSWCEKRLVTLFNDDDQAVRQASSMSFRRLERAALEEYSDLIWAFCDSEAFQDDSFSILHVLQQSLHKLPGMTCLVCEMFLERFSDEARDIRTSRMGDAYIAIELVFRTYQQHQQDEWTATALNLIDRLCLERIGDVDGGFRAFER